MYCLLHFCVTSAESNKHSTGLASCDESPLKDKLVVVIGAGGAGKSLAYGAKVRGARVAVANRNFGTHLKPCTV